MEHEKNDDEITIMRRWRVIEIVTENGKRSRHVCGHDVSLDHGRASTAIVQFEPDTMVATTRSGSKYKLVGVPGNSKAWEFVWIKWCNLHHVVSQEDVSREYLNINKIISS